MLVIIYLGFLVHASSAAGFLTRESFTIDIERRSHSVVLSL